MFLTKVKVNKVPKMKIRAVNSSNIKSRSFKQNGKEKKLKPQQQEQNYKRILYPIISMGVLGLSGVIIESKCRKPVQKAINNAINNDEWASVRRFISKDIPTDCDDYALLLQSPQKYYIRCGREVNKFLRTGKFEHGMYDINDTKNLLSPMIIEQWDFNRSIIDSIDILDKMTQSSVTKDPMTVYRYAPKDWINTAQNNILKDSAYCSTSIAEHCTSEEFMDGYTLYKIKLPEGTKFWDLRATQEREILLPRNSAFKCLGNRDLEYIGTSK